MRPIPVVSIDGHMVPMSTASNTTTSDGKEIALLQKAEQAVGIVAFSSPAHPSHLPDMGMSGMPVAAAMTIFEPESTAPTPCVTSPTASARASVIVIIRRNLANIGSKYQLSHPNTSGTRCLVLTRIEMFAMRRLAEISRSCDSSETVNRRHDVARF